jgi:acetoin utilization protein AcuB
MDKSINIKEILVKDLMKNVTSAKEDSTVKDLLRILKKENTIIIPVVDKNNVLIGIVTEMDLIKLVKSESPSPISGTVWHDTIDKSFRNKPIKEIMSTKIISISPNDTIDNALKMMDNYRLKVLPVVDYENKLLGIIRIKDIFESFLKG